MTLTIEPVQTECQPFVARATGVSISQGVDAETVAAIEAAMDQYAVLVFPDQQVTDDQQYQFSEHFGPMEYATGDINPRDDRRLSMKVNDISNLDSSGQVRSRDDRARLFGLGNMLWHSDSSFKATPAKYSLLSARIVPAQGGNTEFSDMRAAWDDLDEALRGECEDLICEHSQLYSRGKLGFDDFTDEERQRWQPVQQRLVRRHPKTDRLSLFLSSHIGTIVGWPVPEARMFINDLTEHATQRKYVYSHSWQPWDLVMWDNRVVMHRARRYDHTKKRDLHRTTVADSGPTCKGREAVSH
jgi:alpha-ketoglutarate-dependent 2,4-dichlorophenoxyacetate dioxygenase